MHPACVLYTYTHHSVSPQLQGEQRPPKESEPSRGSSKESKPSRGSSKGRYIKELGDFYDPHLYRGFTPLTSEDMKDVEVFVFFLGWQRSGHSIIAGLLDGHPDVLIAHEFFLFRRLHEFTHTMASRQKLFNQLAANSFREANYGYRTSRRNEKGYNLELADSWQGRFRTLRVIGDKTAGDVTNAYLKNSSTFEYQIERLKWISKARLKVINVVRNPYDMIATLSLYRGSPIRQIKLRATAKRKYSQQSVIQDAANTILKKAFSVYEMEKKYTWDFIRIYSEDFIKDPQSVMAELCTFLGLECTESYLQQCAHKTFTTPSRSRELVAWSPATKARIEEAINRIPFFSRYSFDGE